MISLFDKLSKRLIQFHQISLVVIMFTTLATILYFWSLGFVDGSRAKQLHNTSFILESFEKKDQFEDIKQLIDRQHPKEAIIKLQNIEEELEKVNKLISVGSFTSMKKNIQQMKVASANLISFSRTSKIIDVFNDKMSKFNSFVNEKKWRTLSRMSDRILAQTSGYIDGKRLDKLIKFINKDFKLMSNITENSILSHKDKSEVSSRISNLKIEIDMLNKYSEERVFANNIYSSLQKSFKNWHLDVSPEITLQKIQVEQIGKYYVMGLVGILFLVAVVFFSGFIFNKVNSKKQSNVLEEELEDYISFGLVEQQSEQYLRFSEKFSNYSKRISDYLSKRMSFGTIFQDALPLSAIMLDKNLKIEWANKHFCSDWEISEEEINKEYMSWDYLNKLTNIGDDDPVLDALKNKISGIYQVQVRASEDSRMRPYEMFVSPVKYKNETKIMLFFYDLTSLEQTIQDQAKSILGPVKATLRQMLGESALKDQNLETDFDLAGITDIYAKFIQLKEMHKNRENELLNEIEILHTKVNRSEKMFTEISGSISQSKEASYENVKSLKIFKTSMIELSTLAREFELLAKREMEMINANSSVLRESISKMNQIRTASSELLEAFPDILDYKENLKAERKEASDQRARLAQDMAQLSLNVKRGSMNQVETSNAIELVYQSFKELDTTSDRLEKKLTHLDVIMSKAELIVDSAEIKLTNFNAGHEMQQLHLSEKEALSVKKRISSSDGVIERYEDEIIENLQVIFKGTKSIIGSNTDINQQLGGTV